MGNARTIATVSAAVCALFLISLSGCRSSSAGLSPGLVHTETDSTAAWSVRERTTLDSAVTRDSVHIKDSVSVRIAGDTVFTDRWHREYVYRLSSAQREDLRHGEDGSLRYVSVRDTVRMPLPVERELTKWEKFKLGYAAWSMGALAAVLAWFGYRLYKRIKNG